MSDDDVPFILYTGGPRLSKDNRRQIATYIGKNFRNRSKPSTRKDGISLDFQNSTSTQLSESTSESVPPKDSVAARPVHEDDPNPYLEQLPDPKARDHSRPTIPSVFANHDGYGLQSNPFEVLPITPRGSVDKMISYFVNIYAPAHFIRPDFMSPARGPGQIQDFFRFALQSSGLFAALLAVAQCHLSAHANHGLIGDELVLYYYGIGITDLRCSLGHLQDHGSDFLIATIMMLMNVDLNLAHIESFQMHMKGLRLLVQRRGGPDKLRYAAIHGPVLRAFHAYDRYFTRFLANDPTDAPPHHSSPVPASEEIDPDVVDPSVLATLPLILRELSQRKLVSATITRLALHVVAEAAHQGNITPSPPGLHSPKRVHHDSSNLQAVEHLSVTLSKCPFPSTDHITCLALFYERVHATPIGRFNQIIRRLAALHAERLMDIDTTDFIPVQSDILLITFALLVRTLSTGDCRAVKQHEPLLLRLLSRVDKLVQKRSLLAVLRTFYTTPEQCESLWVAYCAAVDARR